MSIDYQSKCKDMCTAMHCWCCDGWARRRRFFVGSVSPNKASETRPTCLNIQPTCSNHDTYISVPPPPTQYRRAILYDTYTIYNSCLQKARDKPLYPPTFQKSL